MKPQISEKQKQNILTRRLDDPNHLERIEEIRFEKYRRGDRLTAGAPRKTERNCPSGESQLRWGNIDPAQRGPARKAAGVEIGEGSLLAKVFYVRIEPGEVPLPNRIFRTAHCQGEEDISPILE